ncbi:unnamed protein product [Thelazia callipaeda]|uniref:E2 ubiquitin-conjugating enzyme n=1 Tax=Thelazia callipaeda TaxID=103827 RepID=A0A0N5CYZ5_THECL|nr:unnamed protein product [Thelazia callipaeda]
MEIESGIILLCVFWTIDLWVTKATSTENSSRNERLLKAINCTSNNLSNLDIIYLLVNLSNTENEYLSEYLREKNYASLKMMIDQKRYQLLQVNDMLSTAEDQTPESWERNVVNILSNTTIPFNLTQEQLKYAEAYRNATIYSIIRALWNTKVAQELPQIDQYAILEYYNEKQMEEESQQSILIWLWNMIRNLFEKNIDVHECYANEPKCVREVLDHCNAQEMERLQQASDTNDLKLINDFIRKKLGNNLDSYIEYDKWNKENDVPEALKEINRRLSQAQRRAMDKLRRLEQTDKIKDFYRDNIEKTCLSKQQLAESGVMIEIRDDSLLCIRGLIRGPPDSPYEGGTFALDMTIPEDYPFQPPTCKFVTKLWHPNISSQTGAICLDILKEQWAASLTLRTVLLSIQALLGSPEPTDPQDAVVAKQYMENIDLYKRTARFWSQCYAKAEGIRDDELWNKVDKLKDMGVKQDEAISALSCSSWDLSKATDYVFG